MIFEGLATLDDGRREAVLAEATRLAIRDVALVPLHHGRVAEMPRPDEWTLTISARLQPR